MPKAIGVLQGDRAKVDEFLREFQSTLKPGESVTVEWENELVTLTPQQIERPLEKAVTNGDVHVWSAEGKGLVVLWPEGFAITAHDVADRAAREQVAFEAWKAHLGSGELVGNGPPVCSGKVVAVVIEIEEGRMPRVEEQWRWHFCLTQLLIGPESSSPGSGLLDRDIDFLTVDPEKHGVRSLEPE